MVFSKQPSKFKYFSSLCEPYYMLKIKDLLVVVFLFFFSQRINLGYTKNICVSGNMRFQNRDDR